MPEVLRGCAVGLVPYTHSLFNEGSFPLKTLEYLAAGLPVVATDLPAIRWLGCPDVDVADAPDAFAAAVRTLVDRPGPNLQGRERRRSFAREHDWERRAEAFVEVLALRDEVGREYDVADRLAHLRRGRCIRRRLRRDRHVQQCTRHRPGDRVAATEAAAQRIRVIVVDNASSDGTVAAVREHADVILLDGGGNRGFAAGINVATTRFGECSTILILNPDAEVAAGSIAVLRRRLRTTGAGAVAPLIQDAAGERYASLRREASTRRALGDAVMGRFFRGRPAGLSEIVHDDTNYATAHPIDWASGAALLIDADVARRVGGWDERFFLYSEEADYLRRVRDAGYTVWFEPDAVVHHAERGSGFSLPLDKLIAVNRIRYARKHMPRARAAAYRAAVALHHLLRSRGPSYRAIFRTVIRESTWWSLPRPHHDTTATSEPDRERRRVVIVAPAADGNDISEAFNAFQWVDLLSQHHDVTVLCTYKEGHVPLSAQLPHVRVIEWQEPPLLGRFERFNSLLQPGYFFFAARARRWLRRHLAGGESFDVAIQVVPVAMRYPSPAAGLGIPFIIGPVGGSLSSPVAFIAEEGGTPWYQRLRALDKLRLRIDPWLRRTYRDADCVLGIAPYAAEALSELAVRRFEVMSEVALRDLPRCRVMSLARTSSACCTSGAPFVRRGCATSYGRWRRCATCRSGWMFSETGTIARRAKGSLQSWLWATG